MKKEKHPRPDEERGNGGLYGEMLQSERQRIFLLGGIFFLLFLASIVSWAAGLFWKNPLSVLLGRDFPSLPLMALGGFGIFYEAVLYLLVGKIISKGWRLPEQVRFGNAFAEVSFVTTGMVILCVAMDPGFAMISPVPNFYYFLVILSTLRLNFPLSLFTGVVAALELLVVALLYLPGTPSTGAALSVSWIMALPRAFVLIGAGLVAGFVAREIRRRVENTLRSQNERARVESIFGQCVSPAVVSQLLHQPEDFIGETKHVGVMFLDIRDFTRFSEKRPPGEVIAYLNTLFGHLITVVNRNHGIINKFLGDGFMAVFGAPLSNGRDVEDCVRASLEICDEVARLNAEGVIPATRIGIGLHAGPAVTGTVGSSERKEYTIIGDTVNLASRVEQLNKLHGSELLVTLAVHGFTRDTFGRDAAELEPVLVKGRTEPVQIYRYR